VEQRRLPWLCNYGDENCGFADQDIRRIMAELHELFDFVSLDEAGAHYQKSPY
jgi:hypothetical protein